MNVGDPVHSSRTKYLGHELRKRVPRDDVQEVRWSILPMKSGNADGGKGPRQVRPCKGNIMINSE